MRDMMISEGLEVLRELAKVHNKAGAEVAIGFEERTTVDPGGVVVSHYRGGVYCNTVEDSVIAFRQPTVRGVVESVRAQILAQSPKERNDEKS